MSEPDSRSEASGYVVIRPRNGVDAREVADWLEANFQRLGMSDAGPDAPIERLGVEGGNPLVNAEIRVAS